MMSFFSVKDTILLCLLLWLTRTTWLIKAIPCQSSAKYKFTFQANWTKESHPSDFPSTSRPHFSPLIGCTHNPSYVMWKPGGKSTIGLRLVAEYGATGLLVSEIVREINSKKAFARFMGDSIPNTGSTTVNVEVNMDYPLVSAVSMIAPSPDWIVGVHDLSLCNQTLGKWIDQIMIDLYPYDAGTDSATTYVHRNTRTTPQEPISRLTHETPGSLRSNSPIKEFGTFTFIKMSTEETTMMPTMKGVTSTPVPTELQSLSKLRLLKVTTAPTTTRMEGQENVGKPEEMASEKTKVDEANAPTMAATTTMVMMTETDKPRVQMTGQATPLIKRGEFPTTKPMMGEKNTTIKTNENQKPALVSEKTLVKPGIKPTAAVVMSGLTSSSGYPTVTMTTHPMTTDRLMNSTKNAACSVVYQNVLPLIFFSLFFV